MTGKQSTSKALGGAAGGGIGYAVNNVLMYALTQQFGVVLPESVEDSMTIIVIALIGWLGVYLAPPNEFLNRRENIDE